MQRNIIGLFVLLILSACAGNVNSSWTCPTPAVAGQKCLDVAHADAYANQSHAAKDQTASPTPVLKVVKASIEPVKDTKDATLQHRTEERVVRVWFAPFVDQYDNRHDESIVYFVDTESNWRN